MSNRYYLNKVDKFYIEQNPDGLTTEELAESLGKSKGAIKKYQEELGLNPNQITKEAAKEETITRQLLGRRKRRGKYVATTMTEAASQRGDSSRSRDVSTRYTDAIHKPFGDLPEDDY